MTLVLPLLALGGCPSPGTAAVVPPVSPGPAATVTCGAERCKNGLDDDCDGVVDEADDAVDAVTVYTDADGDGYGGDLSAVATCDPSGLLAVGGDCDDDDPLVNPAATEVCDGVDNDCDWHGLPGCEWEGEVAIDEVATLIVGGDASDVAAGIDEQTGEPWTMTFDNRANVHLYRDLNGGRVTASEAASSFQLAVEYQDYIYYYFDLVYTACGDVHDLDGDGHSDVVMGFNAFDEATGSFGRLFAVGGPLDGTRSVDLTAADGAFVGDGFLYWGGSQCGAGLDATGDGEPDVLAVGIAADLTVVLSGDTSLTATGDLASAAAASIGVSERLGGGGWADFGGDGVADIYTLEWGWTGESGELEAFVGVFGGPAADAASWDSADFYLAVDTLGCWNWPDRQADLDGDGRDDLLLTGCDDGYGVASLLAGARVDLGGRASAADLAAVIVGTEGHAIYQAAAAGASGDPAESAVVLSGCGPADYHYSGRCEFSGVSVVQGPFAGTIVMEEATSLHIPDLSEQYVGLSVAAVDAVALVVSGYGSDDSFAAAPGLYAIALDEAF